MDITDEEAEEMQRAIADAFGSPRLRYSVSNVATDLRESRAALKVSRARADEVARR